jgi:hypothetical protein
VDIHSSPWRQFQQSTIFALHILRNGQWIALKARRRVRQRMDDPSRRQFRRRDECMFCDMHMSIFAVSIGKQDSCASTRMVALIEGISTSPREQES